MFERAKNYLAEKLQKNNISKKSYGASGTEIFDGIISQDYLSELNGETATRVYDQMRRSDAMVNSAIRAFQLPLLSANYFIEGENEEYVKFIEDALFSELDQNFHDFLSEAYNFPVFGFYYFEKIFKLNKDGKIVWKKFAPRIPSAHFKWPHENANYVEQILPTGQMNFPDSTNGNPQIPWDKLVYFAYQKEGDNFEGISILRPVRQAWLMKQKALKILAVYYERYGIGVPVYKQKNKNKADSDLVENMLKNLRANKQSYILLDIEDELDVFGGDKRVDLSESMIKFIQYQDKQIAKAFHAMFLVSGDDGVGSNAKSSTDIEFFSLVLKSMSKTFIDEMNNAIKELINMNFENVSHEDMPKLSVAEISKVSISEFSAAIKTLTDSGFIRPEEKDLQKFIRENLDFPPLSDEDMENLEKEKEEKKISEIEKEFDPIEDNQVKVTNKPKEKKVKDDDGETQKDEAQLKEGFFLAQTSSKEKLFQQSINNQEKFLQDIFKTEYISIIKDTENKIKESTLKLMKELKTETIGGVNIISSGNSKVRTKMNKSVDKIMKAFQDKLFGRLQDRILKTSMNNALNLIEDSKEIKLLTEILVSEGDYNSFKGGYVSNMKGVVFNEGRRTKERISDNLTQGASITLMRSQINDIKFNRNIYKLSAVTHPRGLYKRTIQLKAQKEGIKNYKMLVPGFVKRSLSPKGISALLLFLIMTENQWNKKSNEKNNINVVGGLGLHHGSQEYFVPIMNDEIEDETIISEEQRAEFLDQSN